MFNLKLVAKFGNQFIGRRGWDFPSVNFLTEISYGPALAVLAFRFTKTRTLLRASNPIFNLRKGLDQIRTYIEEEVELIG